MSSPEIIHTSRIVLQDEDEYVFGFLRPQTSKQRKGEIDFTGGKRNPGETPEQTAIRECEEETGIMIQGELDFLYGVTDLEADKGFTRMYYRTEIPVNPSDITKLPEHIGVVCASKTTVLDLTEFVPHQQAIECLDFCR